MMPAPLAARAASSLDAPPRPPRPPVASAMRRAALLFSLALSACAGSRPAEPPRELVVLVHGMGRSALSMAPMEYALRRAGYRVLNVGYSSQGPGVAEIGAAIAAEVAAETDRQPAPRVHWVGHSLGTVAVRWVLANAPPDAPGRAVFLAPPNRGAASADRLARWVGWALPPIRDLRTTGGPAAELALPPGAEVAVIAGDRDRKVSVAETCIEGADHAVVPSGHTFIMARPSVRRMVRAYLATGDLPGANDAACADVLGH